jgi:hypothetical protein
MKIKVLGILFMLSATLGSCFKEVECGYRDQQYVASSSEIAYMQSFFASRNESLFKKLAALLYNL